MNIQELFNADDDVSAEKITLYFPNKGQDPNGGLEQVEYPNHGLWIDTAATLLAYINRGSTRLPPAGGMWYESNVLTKEDTTLVFSYIDPDRFDRDAASIAALMHTFGERNHQHTVFVEVAGEVNVGTEHEPESQYRSRTYRITNYAKAAASDIPLEELLDHLIPDPLP